MAKIDSTSSETVRNKTIQCRLTEDEYSSIDKRANKLGISASSYLRMVCLMAKPSKAIDLGQFINVLKSIEGIDRKDPREKVVQSRVTSEEYEEIEKKANELGLSVLRYVRLVCLYADLDVSIVL